MSASPVPLPDGRSWIVPVVLLVATWGVSSLVGFFHTDASVTNRITAVETQQKADSEHEKQRLDRIEDKLDRLFYEVTGRKP